MTLRPCLDCGEPTSGPRCTEHTIDTKPTAHARGYDAAWTRLSKRARRLQPFCTDCGSTEDLQTDHTPQAWARKAAGKPIRLQDVRVLCGPCNRAAGAARGPSATRGDAPVSLQPDSDGSRGAHYTPVGGATR
ncbi:hypothetical protein MSAR_42930 [Mycolicibacterium sarraceniae]|uniref:HNH endonuclease n=1 Tax=Mycolicibacterium sarraceniae TaxID=1534348 RepID=A0A7I7SVX5_9MYCO|nr:hypothetical protein MSAR_42930 [Mycolicibacterium sarraceniae]